MRYSKDNNTNLEKILFCSIKNYNFESLKLSKHK